MACARSPPAHICYSFDLAESSVLTRLLSELDISTSKTNERERDQRLAASKWRIRGPFHLQRARPEWSQKVTVSR